MVGEQGTISNQWHLRSTGRGNIVWLWTWSEYRRIEWIPNVEGLLLKALFSFAEIFKVLYFQFNTTTSWLYKSKVLSINIRNKIPMWFHNCWFILHTKKKKISISSPITGLKVLPKNWTFIFNIYAVAPIVRFIEHHKTPLELFVSQSTLPVFLLLAAVKQLCLK